MRIVVAGAHGQVARRLGRLLSARGDQVVGLVRNPAHEADLRADGVLPVTLDLEDASADEVGLHLDGADAVVFAAGAGPGSGSARKETVDRAAAVLLNDAAERAGVPRLLQVSSMGVLSVADGAVPAGADAGFVAYLRAKLAAEDDLRGRELDWAILRPGRLTDDAGTGTVRLAEQVPNGPIPRDDVAATLVALLDAPEPLRRVLEAVTGDEPIEAAVSRCLGS